MGRVAGVRPLRRAALQRDRHPRREKHDDRRDDDCSPAPRRPSRAGDGAAACALTAGAPVVWGVATVWRWHSDRGRSARAGRCCHCDRTRRRCSRVAQAGAEDALEPAEPRPDPSRAGARGRAGAGARANLSRRRLRERAAGTQGRRGRRRARRLRSRQERAGVPCVLCRPARNTCTSQAEKAARTEDGELAQPNRLMGRDVNSSAISAGRRGGHGVCGLSAAAWIAFAGAISREL